MIGLAHSAGGLLHIGGALTCRCCDLPPTGTGTTGTGTVYPPIDCAVCEDGLAPGAILARIEDVTGGSCCVSDLNGVEVTLYPSYQDSTICTYIGSVSGCSGAITQYELTITATRVRLIIGNTDPDSWDASWSWVRTDTDCMNWSDLELTLFTWSFSPNGNISSCVRASSHAYITSL